MRGFPERLPKGCVLTTLAALIERLESAPAGSLELDREILWAWFPEERKAVFDGVRHISTMTSANGEFWFNPLDNREDCPQYSTSIDAALTLVPDNHAWMVRQWVDPLPPGWCAYVHAANRQQPDVFVPKAGSPALALCIAALRARGACHD